MESSFAEQVFIVFMNNLEYDETGVTNYKQAAIIRRYKFKILVTSFFNTQKNNPII